MDRLFSAAGMSRSQVYITNLVKDRPPENRDPSREEIAAYAPFLLRQLEIIKPGAIATLGRFSAAAIFSSYAPGAHFTTIGDMHGQVVEGSAPWGAIRIVPLYHPAAALYNQALYPVLEADFVRMAQSM
jgi:uracil-DNA glycosylase